MGVLSIRKAFVLCSCLFATNAYSMNQALDDFYYPADLLDVKPYAYTPTRWEKTSNWPMEYRKLAWALEDRTILKSEYIDLIPKVAMMGDSLSRDFYVNTPFDIFDEEDARDQVNHKHRNNIFLDMSSSSDHAHSFFEMLSQHVPVFARNYAVPGAGVTLEHRLFEKLFPWFLFIPHLSDQASTDTLKSNLNFPNLLMIWIGHNDCNWAKRLDEDFWSDRQAVAAFVDNLEVTVQNKMRNELKRLAKRAEMSAYVQVEVSKDIDRIEDKHRFSNPRHYAAKARMRKHRIDKFAIVLYGLANFTGYFRVLDEALASHKQDNRNFENLDMVLKAAPSYLRKNRQMTVECGRRLTAGYMELVDELNAYIHGPSFQFGQNVKFFYSNAIRDIPAHLSYLHPKDAMHLSTSGKNRVARELWNGALPALTFTGILK